MHDKHQGSDLSEAAKEVLFHPPPRFNFILKNQILIIKINADCFPADTGERSAFFCFFESGLKDDDGLKDKYHPCILIKSLHPDSDNKQQINHQKKEKNNEKQIQNIGKDSRYAGNGNSCTVCDSGNGSRSVHGKKHLFGSIRFWSEVLNGV